VGNTGVVNASSPSAAPSAPPSERWRARLAVLAILAILVLLASPAVAQRVGRDAADAGRRGRVNATTIQVTVADDTDVDEGSIQAEDFSLSDGDLESINVTESGSNATVNLFLDSGINADTVTVRSPADGNVTDAAGNALADDSVTVTGMDSRLPSSGSSGSSESTSRPPRYSPGRTNRWPGSASRSAARRRRT